MVIAGAACLRSGADGRMDPARIAEVKKRCGIRRADRYTAMMVAAALEAVKDAGFEGGLPEDTGVMVASFLGPHQTTGVFLNELLEYPEDQVLSTAFSHSVFNAAASYVAMVLGIHGPEYSITGIDDIFYEGFASADSMLRTGYCRRMLCVTAFDKGVLTDTLEHIGFPMPEEYALGCLLSAEEEESRHGSVVLSEEAPDPGVPVNPLATAEKILAMTAENTIVLRKGFVQCRK